MFAVAVGFSDGASLIRQWLLDRMYQLISRLTKSDLTCVKGRLDRYDRCAVLGGINQIDVGERLIRFTLSKCVHTGVHR